MGTFRMGLGQHNTQMETLLKGPLRMGSAMARENTHIRMEHNMKVSILKIRRQDLAS